MFCLIVTLLAIACIAIRSFSDLRVTSGKSQGEKNSVSESRLDKSFGLPIEVALNEVKQGSLLNIRFIFLYIQASDFTEENLRNLFGSLAAEYPEPEYMQITVYSDREMLQRAMNRYRSPYSGVAPEDQLPARSGYFGAQYSRQDDAEFFDYSPDSGKEDNIRIWIKRK
jgi:hypothetical protein